MSGSDPNRVGQAQARASQIAPPQQGEAKGRLPIGSIVDRVSPLLLAVFLLLVPVSSHAGEKMSPEEVQALAIEYADLYGLPHGIVLRTVKRESRFIPSARNGPYWGLMQIRYDTAKGVGYRGTATGLLDAETNLNYGVAYLANAYMIAGGNESMTHRLYRGGYYYAAKRKKLLAKLITAPPVGTQPVMVATLMEKPAPAIEAAAVVVPVAADIPLPTPKPLVVVAAAASDESETPASVPLPIPKPVLVAEAPAEAPEPIVAKPQVVLASVLPEPKLSFNFSRDPAPASPALMALAEESAAPVGEPAAGVPIPLPNPRTLASLTPSPLGERSFTDSYFDVAATSLVLKSPVSLRRAAEAAGSTMVASAAIPKPKPKPTAQ